MLITATATSTEAAMDHRVWQLVSPTLPIGGYSYSHALEYAVREGWVSTRDEAAAWILGVARRTIGHIDLPLLLRLLQAVQRDDPRAFADTNRWLIATRESTELAGEDRRQGEALLDLLPVLKVPVPDVFADGPVTLAGSFALACGHWAMAGRDVLKAYGWLWFENQVTAALKLVPLGHREAQGVLLECADTLDVMVARALTLTDDALGGSAPGLAIASSRHERLPARLFQS